MKTFETDRNRRMGVCAQLTTSYKGSRKKIKALLSPPLELMAIGTFLSLKKNPCWPGLYIPLPLLMGWPLVEELFLRLP